jgi:membrane protein required for colicin V production
MLEIVSLFALVAAAAVAVFGLHVSAPVVRRIVHPDWLGTAAALVGVFVIVYLLLRMVGAMIVRQLQEAEFMGVLDRSLGLALGLARGLIVLGALNLMFNAATPKDMQPHWRDHLAAGAEHGPPAHRHGPARHGYRRAPETGVRQGLG